MGGDSYGPLNFAPLTRRYFKLESLSESHGRWGFKTLSLLDTHGATPPDDGDGVDLAWGRPTEGSFVHHPGALFDGNYATGVDDAGVVQVDLGKSALIARINLAFDSTVGGFTYRIQTSDDGTAWTKRQTVSMTYVIPQPFVSSIAANYTCRYLRFSFGSSRSTPGDDVNQRVNEIEVFRSMSPRSVGRERL